MYKAYFVMIILRRGGGGCGHFYNLGVTAFIRELQGPLWHDESHRFEKCGTVRKCPLPPNLFAISW